MATYARVQRGMDGWEHFLWARFTGPHRNEARALTPGALKGPQHLLSAGLRTAQ